MSLIRLDRDAFLGSLFFVIGRLSASGFIQAEPVSGSVWRVVLLDCVLMVSASSEPTELQHCKVAPRKLKMMKGLHRMISGIFLKSTGCKPFPLNRPLQV